jgi:hypothetical protein
MKEPVESWPCKKSFSPAPEEELRKDMMEGACNIVKGIKESPAGEACFPTIGRWPQQVGKSVRICGCRCLQMEEEDWGAGALHH